MADRSNKQIECHDLHHGDVSNHQVSDSSRSPSIASEPPDIRNWFSSYVYQSPELDSDDYRVFLNAKEGESKERGLSVEDSETEAEEDKHKSDHGSDIKVPELAGYVSSTCEPPDIRNWFSSFVYESPVLDSTDFGVTVSRDSDGCRAEEIIKGQENFGELTLTKTRDDLTIQNGIASNGFVKRNNSFRDIKNQNSSRAKDSENFEGNHNLCPARTPGCYSDAAASESHDISQHKYITDSRAKDEDFAEVWEAQPTEKAECVPLSNHGTSGVKLRSVQKLLNEKNSTGCSLEVKAESDAIDGQNDSEWILPNHGFRKGYYQSSNPKSRGYSSSEDGFTSRRNNSGPRINNENVPEETQVSLCKETKIDPVSAVDGKYTAVRWQAMKDITNAECSSTLEIAGKWRCPQKGKADVGPPLKQLRLERWLHRI